MASSARRPTLADTLAARRRFVGRAAERELFATALDAADPDFRVLFLHGPGGIGKSSLVRAWEDDATDRGHAVIHVDARDIGASAEAVLAAIATEVDALRDPAPLTPLPSEVVLVLDTYELLEPVDRWVRTVLVPAFPTDGFLILAGRVRPERGWSDDTALADLTRVITLRNLTPDEGDQLIEPTVEDADLRILLVRRSHGHPLGLAVLADVHRQGGDLSDATWRPDLLGTLVGTFIDSVPGPLHRRALDVLALARVTTESSLRHVLADEGAGEVFDWLRGLSFVDTGPEGLFPHDLARDALTADLRWRDSEILQSLVRASLEYAVLRALATTGIAQQRAIMDFQHFFAQVPVLRDGWDWETFGSVHPEPPSAEDRALALSWFEHWEGAGSAAYAAHW